MEWLCGRFGHYESRKPAFNSRLDKKMLTIMINAWGKSGIPSYNAAEVDA